MNLTLPLLLALSLAGLVWFHGVWRRRSESALAWVICGLAAMAVLAPTMAMPGSIPSPSLLLERLPPWRGESAAPATNPDLMDLTFMIEPWMLYLRQELRDGRLPFWNPHQLAGTPFWGNGSSAPLFPLHLLFSALPLSLGFVVVAWLRIVVGGVGTFRLARELGASREGALLSAVVFPLSGRILAFLMFPMANALCLVPWAFLAVERIAKNRRGAWRALALAGGLQLLAGHPETAVFTAIASGLYLAVRTYRRPRPARAVAAYLGGWALGATLAAVQLLPLAHTILASARWVELERGAAIPLAVTLKLWVRFVLPNAFGHAADGSWWGPFSFVPTTVYCGALTLPLAVVAASRCWGDRRVRALAVVGLFCLLVSYSPPGLHELVLALPVLRSSLYHYLLLGTMLSLALLAGRGLDAVLDGEHRALRWSATGTIAALGAAWWAFGPAWAERGQLGAQAGWTAWGLGAIAVLVLATRPPRASETASRLALLIALVVVDLAFAHARLHPAMPLDRFFARTPAIDFLLGREGRIAGVDLALRPNTPMVFGLDDVRGEDSIQPLAYTRMHAEHLGATNPASFRPIARWDEGWLDRLAVRWVIAAPGVAPPVESWDVAFDGADARVFERPTALPLVRLEEPAGGSVRVLVRAPGRWRLEVDSAAAARLVVAESNHLGWRAWLDGRPQALEQADGYFLGVPVPAGHSTVELRYRPPYFGWATALSFASIVLLLAARRWQ